MKKSVFVVSLFFCFCAFAQYKTSSLLKQGDFYKISVSSTGIHMIDFDFLKSIGLNPQNINPAKIKIYGNGMGMLPQNISTPRFDDLHENAVKVYDNKDAKFDDGEYILFYAQAADFKYYDQLLNRFNHDKNYYTNQKYYFIQISNEDGLRINNDNTEITSLSGNAFEIYDDFQVHENDFINHLQSGREWYGESFDKVNSRTFNFDFSGLVPNTTINTRFSYYNLSASSSSSLFNMSLNNIFLGSKSLNGSQSSYTPGSIGTSDFTTNSNAIGNNGLLTYKMDYSPGGKSVGYLNFIEVSAKRNLQMRGSQRNFLVIDSRTKQFSQYKIENANSNLEIWDITSVTSPFALNTSISGNSMFFEYNNKSIVRNYVSFYPNQINLVPKFIERTANQNIHGQETPHLLIVTHPRFESEANRLANFKNSIGIKTLVVTTDQVYNEFSSGAQDITAIRDCAAMFYKRGGLKNLLLFGACSYDYKDRIPNNTNFVPVYEAIESNNGVNSYCSDDFYAFFGDGEGDWPETSVNYAMLIGVGRLPARNQEDARVIVDKIINYTSNPKVFGKWRNRAIILADNADRNSHVYDAEQISNNISNQDYNMNLVKGYIDAFPLQVTPTGTTAPKVTDLLEDNIKNGVLIVNYSGHGGPTQIASEKLITSSNYISFKNYDKLNFYITATCDFGLCDQPGLTGGALELVLSKNGGGIGSITATRPVYQSTNLKLNQAVYNNIFKRDSLGNRPDFGLIFRKAKNESAIGIYNRSYMFFGDPSVKLALPEYRIAITAINGENPINNTTLTLKALSKVAIEGQIINKLDSNIYSNFNGIAEIDLFDKYNEISTLGQNKDLESPMSFQTRENTLLSSKASVKNGKFSFSFILPKDINYKIGDGKFSFYAFDKSQMIDAGGYTRDILLGGTDPFAVEDNTPPEISLFMDDTTFRNNGLTGSKPLLLVKLYDESGINIARSGIGHEITGVIDGNVNETLILNENYSTELNEFKRGRVSYRLDSLADGNHQITVKAWDTYNNSSEKKLDFIVASSNKLAISQIVNFPNPAKEFTKFIIDHNRKGEELELQLVVFDRMGKKVKEFNENISYSNSTLEIDWDFSVSNEYNISDGIYVYKCVLKSKKDGSESESLQRLVVIK